MKTEKCDRCKLEWELPDNHTRQVYCYICGGMFCVECWQKQRNEELSYHRERKAISSSSLRVIGIIELTSLRDKIENRILAIEQERRSYRKTDNQTMANCMSRVLNELNTLLKDTKRKEK